MIYNTFIENLFWLINETIESAMGSANIAPVFVSTAFKTVLN